jgi:hypothetical protein
MKAVLLVMFVAGVFLAGWRAGWQTCEAEYRSDAESWRMLDLDWNPDEFGSAVPAFGSDVPAG